MDNYTPVEYSTNIGEQKSVRDFMIIFFRRRWIVLGIFLPLILVGIFATLTSTDSFTASSQVLIEGSSVESPSFTERAVHYDILMSTASLVAQSIPVANLAAAAVYDSMPGLMAADPKLTSIQSEGDLRDLILKQVSCGPVGESNILGINFSHRNPDLALIVVAAITDAFMEYNIESSKKVDAIDYYTDQIKILEAEIDSLMGKRVEIYDVVGLRGFPINNAAGIQQMRHMEYSYLQAHSKRLALEQQYHGLITAIQNNPDYLPNFSSGDKSNLVGVKNTMDSAVLKLEKLRVSYQDTSLFILRQEEYVERVRSLFYKSRDQSTLDLKINLEYAKSEEASLSVSLERYRTELIEYPRIERQIAAIDIQMESQKELLENLQHKRGEVRLKAESDQRVSNITPLNQPSLSFLVGGGKKVIYLALAGILGLILGMVVALLVDVQDHRIYDRRQAENVLEIPVLGTISPLELTAGKR